MKWILGIALLLPALAHAQLPIPLLTDVLKPGGGSAEVLNNTIVGLNGNNYHIVQTNVFGRSRGFKLLGFITIKGASYHQAMSRLYGRAQVQEGRPQALANVVHERSSAYLILFSIPKIYVRADLVEFTAPAPDLPPSTRGANIRSPSASVPAP